MQNFEIRIGDMKLVLLSNNKEVTFHSRWAENTHYHSWFEFHYLQKGEAKLYLSENRELIMRENDCLLLPPYESHCIVQCSESVSHYATQFSIAQAVTDENRSVSEFAYYKKLLDSITEPELFQNELLALYIHKCGDIGDAFHISSRAYEKAYISVFFFELCALLKKSTDHKMISLAQKQSPEVGAGRAYIIDNYVTNNYNKKISLDALADMLGICKSQTVRTVKKLTGHTLYELILQQRMNVLETLLKTTDLSLEDIAYHLGYNSYSSFYTAIRQYYHTSPEALRERFFSAHNRA